ncbi:MAG: magnesium transporter CorA family protein [Phycisphaerae bacterium]|nr:magnesium transporter CorA family protein [Phycisphaerae bacterium]MDD5381430.1 magnesium transporter CorA family protein [Phycisphaerae bacterium]
MLKRMYISDNGKLQDDDKAEPLVYVYTAPTDEEKKQLIEQYKIDEHTLNSSLDPDELSRLEFEPEHVAMIFKRPRHYAAEDNFLFKVASTGVFMFKDKLIIVTVDEAQLFEGRSFLRVQSIQDVVLKMINRSILHFLEHLKAINTLAGSIEQLISTSMENKYLLNLFTLEKSLVYYFNATNSNGVLIERLKNSTGKIGFSPENVEILDDLAIENNQCREQANIYSQVLASLMDARASIVANNLNIRIKMLTLLTLAIMLPTFVVSYFSMNVKIPLEASNPASFWIITALALLSTLAFVLFWWRRRL